MHFYLFIYSDVLNYRSISTNLEQKTEEIAMEEGNNLVLAAKLGSQVTVDILRIEIYLPDSF
jgi:hypothetical protein